MEPKYKKRRLIEQKPAHAEKDFECGGKGGGERERERERGGFFGDKT